MEQKIGVFVVLMAIFITACSAALGPEAPADDGISPSAAEINAAAQRAALDEDADSEPEDQPPVPGSQTPVNTAGGDTGDIQGEESGGAGDLATASAPAAAGAVEVGESDGEAPSDAQDLAEQDKAEPGTEPPPQVSQPATNRRVDVGEIGRFPQLIPFDGIRPVYQPEFAPASEAPLEDSELVIGIALDGEAKAYPITVLRFREMVNDELAGIPTLVTW